MRPGYQFLILMAISWPLFLFLFHVYKPSAFGSCLLGVISALAGIGLINFFK